jgi:hypothetical protein
MREKIDLSLTQTLDQLKIAPWIQKKLTGT